MGQRLADDNDVSNGFVRLSLPGEQLMWPEGNAAVRRQIYDEHVRWHVGLIYFLQNDPAIPAAIRDPARTWGWCKDEFVETGHIPPPRSPWIRTEPPADKRPPGRPRARDT